MAKLDDKLFEELIKELRKDKKALNAFKKRMKAFNNENDLAVNVTIPLKVPIVFYWIEGVKTHTDVDYDGILINLGKSKEYKAAIAEQNAKIAAFIKESEDWIKETAAKKLGVRATGDDVIEAWAIVLQDAL